jgi:hypothetical protein
LPKYDPLGRHLQSQKHREVLMTFGEIEKIIGATLPVSAKTYPEWWANEANPRTTHLQARAWLDAGFKATVNLSREVVTFGKVVSGR